MTALGQINAGSRIAASMLRGVAPLFAYKGATQPVTSSTTFVNDSALFLPMVANAIYDFEALLIYQGGTQGSSDFKFQFTGPSGFGMTYQMIASVTTGGGSTDGFVRTASGAALGTTGAGNNWGVTLNGTVTTSSAVGNLQLQFAQNTSNATATIVGIGSSICMWQVE